MARWHFLDPALLWLFPAAYALHLLEELFGGEGFLIWIGRVGVAPLSLTSFLWINAVALAVMILAVAIVARRQQPAWPAIAIPVLFVVNAVLHLGGTMLTGVYSPGLVTSVVLYLPIGLLALVRANDQARGRDLALGAVAGIGVQALVSGVVLAGWV